MISTSLTFLILPHRVRHPIFFFFSSRRRHTRFSRDWITDVCSSDLRDKKDGRQKLHTGSRSRMPELTHILQAVERGEENSSERLLPLVYNELRRLAAAKMA